VELIQQAVINKGWRVLVAAPSNVAVDNVLDKLVAAQESSSSSSSSTAKPHRIAPVRLGHPARLMPAVMRYSLDELLKTHEGTAIVDDVKIEMKQLTSQLSNSNSSSRGSDSGSSGSAAYNRDKRAIRSQLTALRKEVRRREEDVVKNILKTR
jgi:superfamily I DNA and/or RNA helicase